MWGLGPGTRQLIQSRFFGIAPLDPLVLAATAGVLSLSVVLAGVAPAHRAAHIDPIRALAEE
jgi:hypothetical protein